MERGKIFLKKEVNLRRTWKKEICEHLARGYKMLYGKPYINLLYL